MTEPSSFDYDLGDEELMRELDEIDEEAARGISLLEEAAAREARGWTTTIEAATPREYWSSPPLVAPNSPSLSNGGGDRSPRLPKRRDDGAENEEGDPPPATSSKWDTYLATPEERSELALFVSKMKASESLLARVTRALQNLEQVESQHRLAADKTQSLHEVCRRLLTEQMRLDRIVSGIETPMQYFKSIDEISLVFSPATGAARQSRSPHPDDDEFKRHLARLDECMVFLQTNRYFHDSEAYLAKSRRAQGKAFELIRKWVSDEIRKTSDSVFASPGAGKMDEAQMYVRFAEKGKLLRPALLELEKRPAAGAPVLRSLLGALCADRMRLMGHVEGDLVRLCGGGGGTFPGQDNALASRVMRGSDHLARLCAAEHQLACAYFNLSVVRNASIAREGGGAGEEENYEDDDEEEEEETASFEARPGERRGKEGGGVAPANASLTTRAGGVLGVANRKRRDPFRAYLSQLCAGLYEAIRPFIVRENDLDALCDASAAIDGAVQDLLRRDRDAAWPLERALTRIAFDCQERLVYCAVRVVQNDVRGYAPSDFTGSEPWEGWYPPLEKTLGTLSRVYRVVEPAVFEQLASEAVAACTGSLVEASKRVAARHGREHADLFLVKHLLVLREQISPFHASLAMKEKRLDFALTSRVLRGLFSSSSSSSSSSGTNGDGEEKVDAGTVSSDTTGKKNSPMRGGERTVGDRRVALLLSLIPRVAETDVDAKRELDAELKRASEAFVLASSRRALGKLLAFVDGAQEYLRGEGATWSGLASQPLSAREAVESALGECEEKMVASVREAEERAAKYVENEQTRSVLNSAIEASVFKVTNSAFNLAEDLFPGGEDLNVRVRERARELVRRAGELKGAGSG